MHGQAVLNLEHNSCWGCMHVGKLFLHRCMNILIKEKEHTLGIDVNARARPFYPVDIRKFYKANMTTENKEKK